MSIKIDLGDMDWKLLREQKNHLFEILYPKNEVDISQEQYDSVDGIINFIDYVQDEAAKQLDNKIVYG